MARAQRARPRPGAQELGGAWSERLPSPGSEGEGGAVHLGIWEPGGTKQLLPTSYLPLFCVKILGKEKFSFS